MAIRPCLTFVRMGHTLTHTVRGNLRGGGPCSQANPCLVKFPNTSLTRRLMQQLASA